MATSATLALGARRNEARTFRLRVVGIDLTGKTMRLPIRRHRDLPGAPLVELAAVTTAGTQGLRLVSATSAGGVTTSIVEAVISAATMSDATKMPYPARVGDVFPLVYALQLAGTTRLEGVFLVLPSAVDSDASPAGRAPGGSGDAAGLWNAATLSIGDELIEITVDGIELVGAEVDRAVTAAGTAITARDAAVAAAERLVSVEAPAYADAFEAADGSVLGGIDAAGRFVATELRTRRINGQPAHGFARRAAVDYRGGIHYLSHCGQSKMQTSLAGGAHLSEQRYGMIAFGYHADSPTTYKPLVGSDVDVVGASIYGAAYPASEPPIAGTVYLGELAERRDGVLLDQGNVRVLVGDNATGSTSLAQNAAGGSTGNYEHTVSQISAAKTIATSEGWPLLSATIAWDQGEGGSGGGYDYAGNKAAIKNLAAAYQASIAAIDPALPFAFLNVQTNTPTQGGSPTGDDFPIARAQLDAARESPLISMVGPEYPFLASTGLDPLHYPSREANWKGALIALATHRIQIEGAAWDPLTFEVEQVVGTAVILRALGAEAPLAIDTAFLPAQPGMGFTALTGAGAAVAVTGVDLAGSGRLRVRLASYAAGYQLRYAMNAATGCGLYVGGCGNVRDTSGDRRPLFEGNGVNRRLHKWAVADRWTI